MVEIIAAILGAVAGAFALWLLEIPKRRRAKAVEAELAVIHRRARGPYLSPSAVRFDCLYLPSDKPGEVAYRSAGSGDLLCFLRDEVLRDVPDGHPIVLVIENRGDETPEVEMSLDGAPVADSEGATAY